MLAANHVERVSDIEHVRSTLERRESTITQGPIGATHNRRGQSATDTKFGRLRRTNRGVWALAVDVGVWNSHGIRNAASIAKRSNVVEYPVVSDTDLVDRVTGQNVGF